MPQRRPRRGLRQRRQVVRQPDELQRVDHRRRGGQVAEPPAGERERLAHRAARRSACGRAWRSRRRRAGPVGELGVRLVDDHDPGRGVDEQRPARPAPATARSGCSGWSGTSRPGRARRAAAPPRADVDGEVVAAGGRQPLGARARGDDRVHRVRRLEAERACGPARRTPAGSAAGSRWSRWPPRRCAASAARRWRRSGRRPDRCAARRRRGPGSGAASRGDLGGRGRDVGDQLRRRRVRVLVGVEPHGDVELRRAVGRRPRRSSRSGRSSRVTSRRSRSEPSRRRTAP